MNKLPILNCGVRIAACMVHPCRTPQLLLIALVVFVLSACSGPPASPTAIPPSVAQPQQSTPELVKGKPVFENTNDATPVIIVPATEDSLPTSLLPEGEGTPTPLSLAFQLPPTALGIATGGATIVDQPNGKVVANVPAGSTLTVTGRSADGKFFAVYEDDGTSGWVTAGSLQLYGADDLTVVEQAISPAPIVTLLAEQMIPLETSALDAAMAAEANATAVVTSTLISTPVP